MEHAKKIVCLKKLNHTRFTYKSYTTVYCGYTNAATPVCNILQVFPTSKKVVINSFCCFLFSNYGKKLGLLRVTRLMPTASIRCFKNEQRFFRKTITKLIFCLKFDYTTFLKLLN